MEKSLYTGDELTGVIMAYALMRPEGIDGMELKGLDVYKRQQCSTALIKNSVCLFNWLLFRES